MPYSQTRLQEGMIHQVSRHMQNCICMRVCIWNSSNVICCFTWVSGQSLDSSITCASTTDAITITYGSQLFSEVTNIPCTSAQDSFAPDNSVFFENADTQASSNWSSDITGTVSATNAFEYDSSGGTHR